MVSTTDAVAELSATEAANIALASNSLGPVFAKIREAAKNGHYSITFGGIDISPENQVRLQELGYKVEGGRAVVISWNKW